MEKFYLSLLLIFVSSVIIFLFVIFNKHKSHLRHPNLPPGSLGFPFIGESFAFLSTGWKGFPEKFVLDRIAKYSSNVFKTHILGAPFVVFNGAADNKFLFSNETKLLVAWWPESMNRAFVSSLATSAKEEAVKTRAMISHSLKPESLQNYIGKMDTIARRHFNAHWENKDQVSVQSLVKSYTLLLSCKLFMGIEDPEHIARFSKHFNLLPAGLISVPIDFPGTPFYKALKAVKVIKNEIMAILKQKKIDLAEGKGSYTQDIMSHMLWVSEQDDQYLSEYYYG